MTKHTFKSRNPHASLLLFIPAVSLAAALAGCVPDHSADGSFDKTYTVQGPVRVELSNGSGDVHVSVGSGNQVQIHGEIHVSEMSESGSQARVRQIESNPPLSQEGNLVRVGNSDVHWGSGSIDYTITVPATSELKATNGSGDLVVSGVQGGVTVLTGSGDIDLSQIGGDVRVTSGSGDLTLANLSGQLQVTTGNGDVTLSNAKGEVRIQTGNGDIQIAAAKDAVTIQTASGDVEASDVTADFRAHTSSGEIKITGSPQPGAFWELHTISGDISLSVPESASFQLYAHTSSGDIDTQIPITMQGTAGTHELRAKVGDGKAHVEAASNSGSITLH